MEKMTPEQMADVFDADGQLDLNKVPSGRFAPGAHITTREGESKHFAAPDEIRTGHGGTLELLRNGQVGMILGPHLWSMATLVTEEMAQNARNLRS
ncbi:hypothetical protein [Janibacter sp. LM]|uniref:hypothetical protein n=1 Tax=Janibacter sp. LM TaxID=3144845 RepID=UPI0031F643E0